MNTSQPTGLVKHINPVTFTTTENVLINVLQECWSNMGVVWNAVKIQPIVTEQAAYICVKVGLGTTERV